MAEQAPQFEFRRWHKKRVFVHEVAGKYGEVFRQLLEQPRVYKSKHVPFEGGPTFFHKPMINPDLGITQTIECHIDVLAPGAHGQKHGHMNSAVFFVLSGKGYDVHDGIRYDWEAGDVCIVEDSCVHQHVNADRTHEARVLIMKGKPLYMFFHLLFQKNVSYPSTEPAPGFEDFKPED